MTNWPKEIFKILCQSKDKGIQDGIIAMKSNLMSEMRKLEDDAHVLCQYLTTYVAYHKTNELTNEEVSLRVHTPAGIDYSHGHYIKLAKNKETHEALTHIYKAWKEKRDKLEEMS